MHLLSSYTSRCVKEFILDPGYLSIWTCSTGLNKEFCLLKGKEFLPSAKTQTFSNSLCKLHNLLVDLCYCISLFFWAIHWQAGTSAHCVSKPQKHSVSSSVLTVHQSMWLFLFFVFFLTSYTLEKIVIVDLKNEDCYCLTIKCLFCCKWHVFRQWPLSPSLQSQVFKLPWCRKPAGCLERQLRCHLDLYVFTERNSRYTDLSVLAVVLHTVCIIIDVSSLFYVSVCLVVVVVCICLGCFSE